MTSAPTVSEALKLAISHIEHMAAWITQTNGPAVVKGMYSFESLGEDMPKIKAALGETK